MCRRIAPSGSRAIASRYAAIASLRRPHWASSAARAMCSCGQRASLELAASVSRIASPATGPSAYATATARLASMTGGRVEPEQLTVQRGDLPPVSVGGCRGVCVAGGDGGLQLVRPGTALGQRRLGQRPPLGQAAPVPPAADLVSEQDQRAVLFSPRGAAGAGQQD